MGEWSSSKKSFSAESSTQYTHITNTHGGEMRGVIGGKKQRKKRRRREMFPSKIITFTTSVSFMTTIGADTLTSCGQRLQTASKERNQTSPQAPSTDRKLTPGQQILRDRSRKIRNYCARPPMSHYYNLNNRVFCRECSPKFIFFRITSRLKHFYLLMLGCDFMILHGLLLTKWQQCIWKFYIMKQLRFVTWEEQYSSCRPTPVHYCNLATSHRSCSI